MSNVNLSVNPGESKTLTFNTEDTYMPEDLVFDITANSNYIVGNPTTGTPTPNSVAQKTTSPVSAAIWRGNCENISSLYSGLRVTYKVPISGGSTYGTVLDINGLGNHPVVNNNNNDKIGAVSVGSIIDLVYDALPSASVYLNGSSTSVDGVWKVCIPMASTTVAGIVKLGASGGAAAYSHTHNYLTSVSVDGLEGSSIIHSVLCNTASGTAMKQVTPNNTFSVNGGSSLTIKFNYDNTADNPTLSVDDGQSSAPIVYKGNRLTNITGNADFIKTNRLYEFVYDKPNRVWNIVGGIDETYTYYIDAISSSNYNIITFNNSNSLYTDSTGNFLNFPSGDVFNAINKHIQINERVNVFVKLPGGVPGEYEIILFENPVLNASSGCIVFTSSSFEVDSTHIEQSWWRISTLEIFDGNYSGGLTIIRHSYFRPFALNNTITAARYGRINGVSGAPEIVGTSNIGNIEYFSCIQIPPDVEFEGSLNSSWAVNNFTNFPSVSTYYKSLINTATTITIGLENLQVGETFYILLKHNNTSAAHNVTFQSSGSNVTLYGAGTYNLGGTGLMEFSFLVLSKESNTNGEILLTYNEYINI